MELLQQHPHLAWIFALLLGLIFGSFGNVVVARLPKMLQRQWRIDCAALQGQASQDEAQFNLAYPASQCPQCSASIRWYDNLPVLSFLALRGKCRHCGARISVRYPITECLTGLLAVACVLTFGISIEALAYWAFLYVLLLLTLIDAEHMLLPDQLTLPLIWAALLLSIQVLPVSPTDAIIGAAAGYLFLWSVYWLFLLLTKKEGMGYGDFKLLAALGAWLGWQFLPLIILLSSLVGAAYGILMILRKRHASGSPMPFGPFLAVAGGIALFFGEAIYQWYWSLYL